MRKAKEIKEVFVILFLTTLVLFSFDIAGSVELETSMNISNGAPELIKPIPNQSWALNDHINNAFDLDSYFDDPNGDPLSYTFTPVQNIIISIDNTTHAVSFSSDLNFAGTRSVWFIASDGSLTGTSNEVGLTVGMDTIPPQWSSPSKSKNVIYQSDFVNFTAHWTDNVQLKSQIFAVDQGGGWVNQTPILFSGTGNTSTGRVQISAAAGTIVYWMFFAYDTSGNLNYTSIQSFNVSTRSTPSQPPPAEGGGGGGTGGEGGEAEETPSAGGGASPTTTEKKISFLINPETLKVSLKQGETKTKVIKVTNTGSVSLNISISVGSIEQYTTLAYSHLELAPGASKDLAVDFTAQEDAVAEEYFGKIRFNATNGKDSEVKEASVALDINEVALDFEIKVIVQEKYKIAKQGSKVKANITINNLKDNTPGNAVLYIALKDFDGNIYDSNSLEVDLSSPIKVEKELTAPKEAKEGEYIFYGRVSKEKKIAIDSDTFQIGLRLKIAAFLKSTFIFILIGFLAFIIAILMAKRRKNREKERILGL
jgi:hypothetical protein